MIRRLADISSASEEDDGNDDDEFEPSLLGEHKRHAHWAHHDSELIADDVTVRFEGLHADNLKVCM
jgi:hypothetical protein